MMRTGLRSTDPEDPWLQTYFNSCYWKDSCDRVFTVLSRPDLTCVSLPVVFVVALSCIHILDWFEFSCTWLRFSLDRWVDLCDILPAPANMHACTPSQCCNESFNLRISTS